ncbi:dolichol phosphate-mannose biosynthesis regulatory [Crassisporium funariophilum]|nr:dolichol phosphate-mannose biosynthesis regulatory [Crassisporium funariophilum]
MVGSDRVMGGVMLLTASTVFTYYTIWTMLLPFFDSSNPIHNWFLPRERAIQLPAFILVIGLTAIGLFLGSTILKESRRKAQQARLRTA